MSIINEALKKTEQQLQKNAGSENLALKPKPGIKPVLLYILILLAGLALGNIIFNLLRYKVKPAKPIEKTVSSSQLPVAPVVLPAAPDAVMPQVMPPAPKQDFVLNGIFFSDSGGYALVNNQIVKQGDSVDGAKVVKITVNSVEINWEGEIITLATNR